MTKTKRFLSVFTLLTMLYYIPVGLYAESFNPLDWRKILVTGWIIWAIASVSIAEDYSSDN